MSKSSLFILIFVASLLLAACDVSKSSDAATQPPVTVNASPQLDSTSQSSEIFQHRVNLVSLLNDPLDFQAFKKTKKGANSGHVTLNFYSRPTENGFLYQYSVFEPSDMEPTAYLATVYKFGETIKDYNDTAEVLLGFNSKVADSALGDLNLVGQDVSTIVLRYGDPNFFNLETAYYSLDKKYLILKIEDEKVKWFKYLNSNCDSIIELPAKFFKRYW